MIKKILACALFAFVIFANIYPLAGKPQEQIDCQITIDRTSVPDLYFKNLTLLIQVNDATNFTLTAGVDPVPFTQAGDHLVATTTEDDLNLNLTTGSNLGGLCDVEKAHLLADKRWAWSHGFDDNVDLHDAIDEFRAKSWPATLFNIAKDYDQTRNESWIVDEPYVNTVLLPEGWVLGNHSWSHGQFTQTVPVIDGYREDIVAAQTRFEEGIARSSTPGLQVMVFASPNFSAAYDEPFAELTATTDLKLMENGNDYMLTVTDAEPFTAGTQTAQPLTGRTTIGRDPRIEWSTIPIIAAMDWMATHSTADRRFWYNTLSHGNHEVNIKTVIDYVSVNYGAGGTDEVWVTSSSEIYSYILTRDNATLSVVKPNSIPTVTPTLPPDTETPTATPVTPTSTPTVTFTPTLTATSVVGTITMTPTSIPVTPTNTPTVGIPTSTPIPTATTVGTLGCQITVDRSAVPDLSFQNLTLLIQVNDATNIALTAGGSEVPFMQVGNQLIATTAYSELYLNFSQGNQLGGLCEVEKAPLLNDKQWAWSHGFDDNVGLRNGINEFRAKSWPATLFNIAIDYDQARDESWIVDEPYVNNVLIPEGWVLGNHSWNNERFDTENPTTEDYQKDILDAQTRLEAGIARSSKPDLQVMVFAAPNSSVEYDEPFNELTATTDLKLMESGNDYLLTLTDEVAFTADGRTAMSFTGRTKIGRDLRIAWSADDAIAEIDWMASHSIGAQRFWYNSYAKGDSEVSIKAVLDHVWDNYGPNGTDEAWVTSSSEIYSYLLTRDNAVIRVVKPSIIPTSTPQPTPSSTPTMVSTETPDVLTPTPDGTPAVNVSPTPTFGDQRFFYLPLIVR